MIILGIYYVLYARHFSKPFSVLFILISLQPYKVGIIFLFEKTKAQRE